MEEKLFALYERCFPDNIRSVETVKELLALPENVVFPETAGEKLLGAAVVNGNTVLLLCVLPEHRRQGLGSRLLERCEEHVRQGGFSEIRFCDGPEYLTPGIPLVGDNGHFFGKRGYVHAWGDCECVDMQMRLKDFRDEGAAVGDTLLGVAYRWAGPEDREQVVECVSLAYPEFAQYYRGPELYDGVHPDRVLMAVSDGVVCGALLVSSGTESPNVGSAGCTAVREEFRRRGIAAAMVKLGTGYLKGLGLETGFIGYTYTDIVPLYAKSGYRISRRYLMGTKAF